MISLFWGLRGGRGNQIDEMAKDVVGVMEYFELDRAHIVGSSLGVEVGLSLVANFPERVISLVGEGALYSEYGPYGIWDWSEPFIALLHFLG